MKKFLVVLISVGALYLGACSGLGGTKQGDECGGSTDDCSANLTCQPIKGRGKSFCCPTPPESSDYQNCHAAN